MIHVIKSFPYIEKYLVDCWKRLLSEYHTYFCDNVYLLPSTLFKLKNKANSLSSLFYRQYQIRRQNVRPMMPEALEFWGSFWCVSLYIILVKRSNIIIMKGSYFVKLEFECILHIYLVCICVTYVNDNQFNMASTCALFVQWVTADMDIRLEEILLVWTVWK